MSQNDLLSSHITVSSILLCPALYCVQHITVSTVAQSFHVSTCCGRIMLRLRSTSVSFKCRWWVVKGHPLCSIKSTITSCQTLMGSVFYLLKVDHSLWKLPVENPISPFTQFTLTYLLFTCNN